MTVTSPHLMVATEARIHLFTSGLGVIHTVPAIGNTNNPKSFRVSLVTDSVGASLNSDEGETSLITVAVVLLTAIMSTTVAGATVPVLPPLCTIVLDLASVFVPR